MEAHRGMDGYGWEEDPPDGLVTRARTKLGQLRVWQFGKEGITQINGLDFAGPMEHPGIYLLYDEEQHRAYVGETGNLSDRLKAHLRGGPGEFRTWDEVIVINDGRNYAQSVFTDGTLRGYLEKAVVRQLNEMGHYKPVNTVTEPPLLSVATKVIAENLEKELLFVLDKLDFVTGVVPIVPDKEIPDEEVKTLLDAAGHPVAKVSRDQWLVNNEPYFLRPGTKPRRGERGWHITLRLKPRQTLASGKGALLIPRGRGYSIPAADLQNWLHDELGTIREGKEAIDIYADLRAEQLLYKVDFPPLDLTHYRLREEAG
jgi:hypothetical protein